MQEIMQMCILCLKFIFLPPPPFWFIFCPQPKFIIMRGCALQAKNFPPFFAILYILSQLGEKYAYFLPIAEKNMHFPSFFISFQFFFPQPVIWPYFCPPPRGREGGSNRKIYTPEIMKIETLVPSKGCTSTSHYSIPEIMSSLTRPIRIKKRMYIVHQIHTTVSP